MNSLNNLDMTENTTYIIDQLDESMKGEISSDFASKLREDKELASDWDSLQIALAAIREAGLREQVAAVADEYHSAKVIAIRKPVSNVRPMFRNLARIAASVFLLLAVGAIYKYSSVNSTKFYTSNFSDYELSVSRGANNLDLLEKAYREKNWAAVFERFNALEKRNNKSIFLAAMANLELKKPDSAIPLFSEVLKNNADGTDAYFHDESEYYLAMSFLGNNESSKAIPILEKIKADPNHLYNKIVREMSWTDLRIIQYKSGK
jgi:hypothetical protein